MFAKRLESGGAIYFHLPPKGEGAHPLISDARDLNSLLEASCARTYARRREM
jgi:hypothetical protein